MLKPGILCAALAAAGMLSTTAHGADDSDLRAQISALKAQLEKLEEQVKALDTNVGAAPKNFALVTKGDEEGTYKLPGSQTSVGVYGFIHVDAYKDLKGRTADWAFEPGTIAIANDPSGLNKDTRTGKFNITPRVTRLGVKTHTPTDMGTLRTKLEFDFYEYGDNDYKMGYSSGFNPRLRHAYGELEAEWGTLLVGQTWSTFMNDAAPETVDFNGPGSVQIQRQPMIRLSREFGGAGTFAVALENSASMVNGERPQTQNSIDKRPDVILSWTKSGDLGFLAANLLSTRYTYDDGANSAAKNAYGYSVGAGLKLGKQDTLLALHTGGNGIARYLPSANYNWEVYDTAADRIRLSKARAYTLGWARNWTDAVRSNLSYGETRLAVSSSYLATYGEEAANTRIRHAFANVFWAFTQNTELGLEYAWARRELSSGDEGTYRRLQGSMRYTF
ncbi:MAG: hypothetical protein JSS47_14750 [Proteobacteria bacterium]|nr:hypothetical protein [Pseudomonadota bacterium]